jgi:hypothetical protein
MSSVSLDRAVTLETSAPNSCWEVGAMVVLVSVCAMVEVKGDEENPSHIDAHLDIEIPASSG